MKPLPIVHIITKLELGGAQQNTLFTIEHLNRERFQPYLIANNEGILVPEATALKGVKTFLLPELIREINPFMDMKALFKINGILRSLKKNNAAMIVTKKKPEEHKKVLNKIMYYETNSDTIQCGDIIRISDNENLTLCGIIVSPKCDLAQKNTRFLEIIVLKKFQDDTLAMNSDIRRSIKRQNEPSFYLFPALKIENKFQDMVAVLKSKIILEHAPGESIENQIRYPKALKRLEYSDTFLYRGNYDKKQHLELLCSLDEPYKSDFLQRLQSHNSRVGIPDIRDLI